MPIGTPVGIGSGSTAIDSTPEIALGAAPSNTLVIMMFAWGASVARTLDSVSGGGLTWAIDHTQAFSGGAEWGFAVCSAQAPAGMGASTVTGTLSANPFGCLMAGIYCEGLDPTSPGVKDISDGQGQAAVTAWDTTATSTTVNDTLVIGGSLCDGLQTNTVSGGATELYDFQFATEAWSMCVEYKILSAIASTSLTGTWTGGNSNKTSAFVAYKGGAAADPATTSRPFTAIPFMGRI